MLSLFLHLILLEFSRISQILSKARNRLDIVKRGDLRLSLTSIEPNIKKLVEKHQPQGSHLINMPFPFFFNHTLNFNCFFFYPVYINNVGVNGVN